MPGSVVVRALLVLGLAVGAFGADERAVARAQTVDLLAGAVDGAFEAGGTGWIGTGLTPPIQRAGAQHSGAGAAHIEATSAGLMDLRTQYWLVPTVPYAEHTLAMWLYDDDPGTSNIQVTLRFVGTDGMVQNESVTPVGSGTSGWRPVTVTLFSDEGAAYAQVLVTAHAAAAGATLYLDDVSLQRGPPSPPPPTRTPTIAATPQPTATVPAAATASATSPPSGATATPTSTSTTPTAVAGGNPGPYDVLTNGGFDAGLHGWADVGAEVEAVGGGVRLTSESTSTKYLYQIVRVTPGTWYAASARLLLGQDVDAAWVRIAWYSSSDGGGAQLSTGDSEELRGGTGVSAEVSTGPLQAPGNAHTAAVRIMLRPLGSGLAQLTVDDVRFGTVSPPPPPAPTVATAPGASAPPPSAAPPGVDGQGDGPPLSTGGEPPADADPPGVSGGPAPRLVAGRPVDEGSAGTTASGGDARPGGGNGGRLGGGVSGGSAPATIEGFAPEMLLRITEVMPDPLEPGSDSDFEWVEVSNIGPEPLSLAGLTLRDNRAMLALPDIGLQPGASIVLAGPHAAVPEGSAFRLPAGLFNGLGNGGDRLALVASDGRIIDALSYGTDTTYDNPSLPAPGAGRSLKRFFGDDGVYIGYEVADVPSPGQLDPPPPQEQQASDGSAASRNGEARPAPAFEAPGEATDWRSWSVLAGLGGVALLGAGGQRLWTRWRRE